MFGGGGTPAPQTELILQLTAVLCFLAMLYGPVRMSSNPRPPQLAWAAAGLILAIPVLQLIPLPPTIWQSMPGRGVQTEALILVDAQDQWRSWSLFPGRTLASLLAVVPAMLALLATSRLNQRDFKWPVAVIMGMILLSLVLGAAQMAAGDHTMLRFYAQTNPGFLNGFQANRNAQADVLLIGMVAATATIGLLRGRVLRTSALGIALSALAVLALGVVLSGSRTGIALIPITLIFCSLVWYGWQRKVLVYLSALLPVAIITAWLLQSNGAIQKVIGRFDANSDFRSELWSDAIFAIAGYWPFGSGIGSAAPVLAAVERLEVVDITIPNRVHNDYLEFALEAGIFGLLVVCALATMIFYSALRYFRKSSAELRRLGYFPLAIITIIGLHSVVDYPLRSMSLATIAAMALGMLLARPTETANGSTDKLPNGVNTT